MYSKYISNTPDPHNHKCRDCNTIWHHDAAAIPIEANERAHACPKCGTQEYFKYDAKTDAPQFCSNGIRCIALDGSGKIVIPAPIKPRTDDDRLRDVLIDLLGLGENA